MNRELGLHRTHYTVYHLPGIILTYYNQFEYICLDPCAPSHTQPHTHTNTHTHRVTKQVWFKGGSLTGEMFFWGVLF